MATLDKIKRDPGTPYWALEVIRLAESKDPVDAANVLMVLADAFDNKCIATLLQDARAAR